VELKFESSAFATGFITSIITFLAGVVGIVLLQFFGKKDN
jgi:hypothetical protein